MNVAEYTELKKVEKKFKLGIGVYEPIEDGTWRLITHYEAVGIEPMTIGWYSNHAFLMQDIKKIAKIHPCAQCNQHFTNTRTFSVTQIASQAVKQKSSALKATISLREGFMY